MPVHVHPTQDEFILVQDGQLELKLDGVWHTANAGDLVRMPRGVPHGYFNKSDKPARALFWVSPAGKLRDLFETLHNMTDIPAVIEASARTRSISCRPRRTSKPMAYARTIQSSSTTATRRASSSTRAISRW